MLAMIDVIQELVETNNLPYVISGFGDSIFIDTKSDGVHPTYAKCIIKVSDGTAYVHHYHLPVDHNWQAITLSDPNSLKILLDTISPTNLLK